MVVPLLVALLIGAFLALFGAGGSILTVPVLVYLAGLDIHQAAGTSLVVVGTVAAIAALVRRRTVKLRTGLVFGAAGMIGALPGTWLNHHLDDTLVLVAFALTMFAAAWRLGRTAGAPPRPGGTVEPAAVESSVARLLLLGVAVGVATGLFGVGGGFLIVPALTLLVALPLPAAVSTSLLVIALNSAAALVAHGAYGGVHWQLGAAFAGAAVLGALVAWPLARRCPAAVLQRAFAGVLVTLGVLILAQTCAAMLA